MITLVVLEIICGTSNLVYVAVEKYVALVIVLAIFASSQTTSHLFISLIFLDILVDLSPAAGRLSCLFGPVVTRQNDCAARHQ